MNKDKMELEEAKRICEDFLDENKNRPIILHKAIKTVLQALDKEKYFNKIHGYHMKYNFIPKKKIEDILEEVYTDEGMGYELDKDEKTGAVRVLRKLLEEK